MLKDIVAVKSTGEHNLWLRFEDGVEGEVNLKPILSFKGVFAPLTDLDYFELVSVNQELGTICWPNGADMDPLVLYSLVTKQPIANYLDQRNEVNR